MADHYSLLMQTNFMQCTCFLLTVEQLPCSGQGLKMCSLFLKELIFFFFLVELSHFGQCNKQLLSSIV